MDNHPGVIVDAAVDEETCIDIKIFDMSTGLIVTIEIPPILPPKKSIEEDAKDTIKLIDAIGLELKNIVVTALDDLKDSAQ